MSATLTIPEKSSQEIKLVYKFLQSKVETTTGKDLLLEVSGEKIDTPNAIVKYLVAQANKPELLGNNNEEQAQVDEWLSFATQGLRNAGKKEVVSHIEKKFNEHLSTHTFFVGNHLTIVDVVIFGILHSYTKNFKATTCPNTLRWFDLIQHMVIKANNLTEDFPLFEVNLDDVPEPAAPVVASNVVYDITCRRRMTRRRMIRSKRRRTTRRMKRNLLLRAKRLKAVKSPRKKRKRPKRSLLLLLLLKPTNLLFLASISVLVTLNHAKSTKALTHFMLKKLMLVKRSLVRLSPVLFDGILLNKWKTDTYLYYAT
ncbi:hypothetical protein RMATCC62417_03362 [Rhizopus microsporus]|nr:hypothetical protein RMATCC62417_03362 [Rhizopus microsporus]